MRDPDDIAWAELRRGLYALCIREHGASLTERLCALPDPCPRAREEAEVAAWVDRVLRGLEGRVLAARASGGASGAGAMVGLFAEPRKLADLLAMLRSCLQPMALPPRQREAIVDEFLGKGSRT